MFTCIRNTFIILTFAVSIAKADNDLTYSNTLNINLTTDSIDDGYFYEKDLITFQTNAIYAISENSFLSYRSNTKSQNFIESLDYTICSNRDTCLTVGSHDIYHGFYGSGNDISITGVGILPQGVYNYNFIDGAFNVANGLAVSKIFTIGDNIIKPKIQYGVPFVQSQESFERAIFSTEDKHHSVSTSTALTVSLLIDMGTTEEILLNWTRTDIHIKNDVIGPATDMYKHFKEAGANGLYLNQDPEYLIDISRIGYRHSVRNYDLILEAYRLDVRNDTLSIPGSEGYYIMLQSYDLPFAPFIGYTQAKSDGNDTVNSDLFTGFSIESEGAGNSWIMTIDLHLFNAESWVNDSSDPFKEKDFYLLSLSYSYKF